jgi:hypothetical protein
MDLIAKINLFFMLYAALLAMGMFILLFLFIRSTRRTRVQPTVPQPLRFDNGSSIFLHDVELSTLVFWVFGVQTTLESITGKKPQFN